MKADDMKATREALFCFVHDFASIMSRDDDVLSILAEKEGRRRNS